MATEDYPWVTLKVIGLSICSDSKRKKRKEEKKNEVPELSKMDRLRQSE